MKIPIPRQIKKEKKAYTILLIGFLCLLVAANIDNNYDPKTQEESVSPPQAILTLIFVLSIMIFIFIVKPIAAHDLDTIKQSLDVLNFDFLEFWLQNEKGEI